MFGGSIPVRVYGCETDVALVGSPLKEFPVVVVVDVAVADDLS